MTDRAIKQRYYLTKAKEADEKAEEASTPSSRNTWLKIADNYRELAKQEGAKPPRH